ncbi:endonuclease [Roseibium denhamense]|uniref:Metal-dependent hydrolase, endonuclease/exonuclease/phosphatase family n=1 Tax=Roseibium denhamense TaxID=76305 RepID=A0ABY1NS16_9HYPH|nr:endonuclease/exonuclease/phosphatase family protein [Roseibium denhamense]MTI08070.1 endonuclease [Roseibium denhamense]SMP16101.1 Metal-dependent hydrolase, endonuclease/exonuclease/phosphatase family [Roseibium denhamense]
MLKIGSYNIQKSIGVDARRRPERTLSVIRELECDVLALQEADKRFGPRNSTLDRESLVSATDYQPVPFATNPNSLGWHGNAILVRKSFSILAHRRIELPTLEPRGAVAVDLDVGGVKIRVTAMHLSLVGHFRKKQIASLMHQLHEHVDYLPTILIGDLNEWRDSAKSLKMLEDRYEVTTPGRSFPSPMPVGSLDRIITSPEFLVKRAGVHKSRTARIASDHLPVWAELTLDHTAHLTG